MAACHDLRAASQGTAGAIYPIRSAFATPDLMLWTESGEFIISVMTAGSGPRGPILGGAFFTILRDKASSFVTGTSMPAHPEASCHIAVARGLRRPAVGRLPARRQRGVSARVQSTNETPCRGGS